MKIHCVHEKLPPRYLDPWNAVFGKLPVDLGRNSWCFTRHLMGKFMGIAKTKEGIGWMRFWRANWRTQFCQLDATYKRPSDELHPEGGAVEHHQFSEFSEKAMIWHKFSTTLKIHPNPNTRDDLSPYPMALWPCTTLTTVSRWILSPSRRTKIPPSSNLPAPRVKKKAEKFGIRFVFDETNISRSFASEKKKKKVPEKSNIFGFRVRWNLCINKGLSCFTGWKVDPKYIAAWHQTARLATWWWKFMTP